MSKENILLLDSIQIKKICRNGEFSYLEFKDLEDPEYLWKEYSNGDKEWWLNGERHREGGPAIEWADGDKEWWLNGKLHREDGPAVEYSNGAKCWFLNGKRLTEKEHQEQTQPCINKVVEIDGKKYKLVEA